MSEVESSLVRAKTHLDMLDLAEYTSVEGFMNKIFFKDKPTESSSAVAFSTTASGEVDSLDRTSNLIEAASQAIEALSTRCEILGTELEQERAHSFEQATHMEVLKEMVLKFEAKIAASENSINVLTLRCHAAEERVVDLETDRKVVTLRATRAEGISSKLQQQVEAAFGHGSSIRSVMDSVKCQQAAE